MTDPFWINDISILWYNDRLIEFFPTKSQTVEERLNSIVRLAIYTSCLLYIYNNNYRYFFIAIITAILTYYVYTQHQPEEVIEHIKNIEEKKQCTKPTIDNPFMNVTMKDYLNIKDGKIVDRPPACDTTDPEIKKEIDVMFKNNLFQDIDDLFEKFNSQRQFYTTASTTIPNDRDSFQKWLYASPKTCKQDQENCYRYEDIRANRPVQYNENENPKR